MSKNIYKVTSVIENIAKNGNIYYKIELDGNIWAKMFTKIKKVELNSHDLNEKNTLNNLNNMQDKFILTTLEESKYGYNIDYIESFDVIKEFKNLLEKSNGKSFSTNLPIFSFLKNRHYKVNSDNSITLKKPYDNYNIIYKKRIDFLDENQTIGYSNNINSLFQELLDTTKETIFLTNLPIYSLLMMEKYKVNSNYSITLKEPYSNYNIISSKEFDTICYTTDLNDINILLKKLLDEKGNNTFHTKIPLFKVLMLLGFTTNQDGSITLQKPYNSYKLVEYEGISLCYHQVLEGKILDFNNIDKICRYFKVNDDSSINTIIKYTKRSYGIEYDYEHYSDRGMRRSHTRSNNGIKLEYGTLLTDSQYIFINEV